MARTSDVDELSRAELAKEFQHDYSDSRTGIVPLSERRPLGHFIALWMTLAAGFTCLFLGFQYHDAGYSLQKAVLAGTIGAACYLIYALPAAYLGSTTGQTYALLTRSIFGKVGSALVTVLLIGVAALWIGFAFNLLATMYDGLFGWGHIVLISVLLALVGIANNLFGFTGISLFARYVVAPLMIAWVVYLVIKGWTDIPSTKSTVDPAAAFALPFLTGYSGVSAAIGSVMWGNEPDTWRYGQPRFLWPLPAYLAAVATGLVLFVAGGWMMAELSHAGPSDFGGAYRNIVEYSLFGALWLGAIVATVLQFAINDGNYYEMINGGQNAVGHLARWRRVYTCLVVAVLAAVATWWFPHWDIYGFYKVTGWSAIALPSATVVMCVDQFVLPRLTGMRRSVEQIPSWRSAALGNWPAIVAVLAAVLFGAWGLALFPGQTAAPSLGLVPVESWLIAGALYIVLAMAAGRNTMVLGYPTPPLDSVTADDAEGEAEGEPVHD